jgi:uncharacterized membrane protein
MLEIIGYVLVGMFLLMVLGFLFSLVLYPKLGNLDFWTRVVVSLGLGVMLLIYVGFFIAEPELRMLQFGPFVGVTLALCAVLAVIAYIRGGAEVVIAYTRAVVRFFRKFRVHKPPQTSTTSQPKPENRPDQTTEKKPSNNLPNRGAGSVDI